MNKITAEEPYVSVVVGFKDWGLERLELSIKSIHDSLHNIPHEVVVSDYGSTDRESIAIVTDRVGAHHEVVQTDGEWSRSRALNAGVRASTGEYILATDADMLFTPGALARVTSQLEQHANQIVILQCRDLPTGYSHEIVAKEGFDWPKYASIAQIRPRWGMGGLVAVRRSLWNILRGWDERMHTYGGEDIDFAKRAQLSGARVDWLDEPDVAMYHIWHPSSGASAARSPEAVAAIANNRKIHTEDRTFARNRVDSRYLPEELPPVVSIFFEGAEDDPRSSKTLASILGQSIRDIEIFVSSDSLRDDRDPRIKIYGPQNEIPAGTFIATIRSGEIWADDYLESMLSAWKPGIGLISSTTARLLVDDDGDPIAKLEPLKTEAPNAGATLARASLLGYKCFYDRRAWAEAVRTLAASGAGWEVVPEALHVQIDTLATEESSSNSRTYETSRIITTLQRCGLPSPQMPEPEIRGLGPRANAALYGRAVALRAETFGPLAEVSAALDIDDTVLTVNTIETRAGAVLRAEHTWTGSSLLNFIYAESQLKARGVKASLIYADDMPDSLRAGDPSIQLARAGEEAYGDTQKDSLWVAIAVRESSFEQAHEKLLKTPSFTVVLDRIMSANDHRTLWLLAKVRHDSRPSAWQAAAEFVQYGSVSLIELPATSGHSKESS